MNLRFCSLALLCFASAGLLQAETFREPFNEVRPLSPAGRVEVDNTNGAITVRTWDRNEVRIAGEKVASDQDALQDLQIEIEATPDSVVVRAKKLHRSWLSIFDWGRSESIRFDLMVPAGARLDSIHTVNGAVDIAGVTGAVRASSVNGAVRATGLGGGAHISTVNGAVHAEFASAAIHEPLSFSTVNGAIMVMLPRSALVEARTSTVNGRVVSDFPSARGDAEPASDDLKGRPIDFSAHTVNGAITVRAVPDKI
jgi:hypothetical protein